MVAIAESLPATHRSRRLQRAWGLQVLRHVLGHEQSASSAPSMGDGVEPPGVCLEVACTISSGPTGRPWCSECGCRSCFALLMLLMDRTLARWRYTYLSLTLIHGSRSICLTLFFKHDKVILIGNRGIYRIVPRLRTVARSQPKTITKGNE